MNSQSAVKSLSLFGIIAALFTLLLFGFPATAYADSDVNYVVDSTPGIGTHTSIQTAVASAEGMGVSSPTNFTITVNPGTYSETVKILQQENKNVTLTVAQPGTVTLNGRIEIDGMGRDDGEETLAIDGFTIIDQLPGDSNASCVMSFNSGGADHFSYVHNLTVSNCLFDSNVGAGGVQDTTGVRIQSGKNGEGSNVSVENCSVTTNMHSLMQVQGGVENLSIKNCIVDGTKGANLIVTGSCTIENCSFNAVEYALRFGSGSPGTALSDCTVTMTNCTLSVNEPDAASGYGTIVTRGDAPNAYVVNGCTLTNEASGGAVWNNLNEPQSNAMSFNLTENYWGSSGCTANSFAGMDATALANIFNPANNYLVYLDYDANGGTFPDGSTMQSGFKGTVVVTTDTATQQRTSVLTPLLPAEPTKGAAPFEGWFTAASGGNAVTADGSGAGNASVVADATLYAQWGTDMTPKLSAVVNPLYLASDVTLTEGQFLAAIGAQAFDGLGNELPLSSIQIENWDAIKFGVENVSSGIPYTVTLSVTDSGLTATLDAAVYVMPEGTEMTPVQDYKAAGLPDPPEGFEWDETPDGTYVLAKASPTPPPPPGPPPAGGKGSPKTGDFNGLAVFSSAAGISAALAIASAVLWARKRRLG